MTVEKGKEITLEYTLTVDGQVLDSSRDGEPLQYVQGKGMIIKGLETQLEGMHVGDTATVVVQPEEGYGVINPQALKEVPKSSLPDTIEPREGQPLLVQDAEGQQFRCRISQVKDDSIVVDLNHPLAGKELHFEVRILHVAEPTAL